MAKSSKRPRNKVFLVAYAADGTTIERIEMSYDDYYDGSAPVVDDDAYRRKHRIRRLAGEIYNRKGILQQSFDNTYGDDGGYVRSRIINADGTVFED